MTARSQAGGTTRVEPLEARRMLAAHVGAVAIGGPLGNSADAVAIDRAGHTIVGGRFAGTVDFDGGAGSHLLNAGSKADRTQALGYVAKYGADGRAPVWVRAFDDPGVNVAHVATDAAGHVYVGGSFWRRADLDPSRRQLVLKFGKQASFVAKFTANGRLIWARVIGAGTGARLAVDRDGNVFAAGVDYAFDAGDPRLGVGGRPGPTVADNLVKLDSAGRYAWSGHLGVGVFDLTTGRRGGVFLTGRTRAPNGSGAGTDVDPGPAVFEVSTDGRLQAAVVIAVGADGALDWATSDGDYRNTTGGAIAIDGDDNVIVGATRLYRRPAGIDDNPRSAVALKFDPSGHLLWKAESEGGSVVRVDAVGVDAAGNVVLGGRYWPTNSTDHSRLDFNPGPGTAYPAGAGNGYDGAFVARYDARGAFLSVDSAIIEGGTGERGILMNDLAVYRSGAVRAVGKFGGSLDVDAGPGVTVLTSVSPDMGFSGLDGDGFVWELEY